MLDLIIKVILTVLAMLVAVPLLTDGNVKVRSDFFGGLVTLLLIGVLNVLLWFGLTLVTVGGVVIANLITCGIVGLLINGLAISVTGKLLPEVLYVRHYGWAVVAGLIMTVVGYFIHHLVF